MTELTDMLNHKTCKGKKKSEPKNDLEKSRFSKKGRFVNERKELVDKLFNILGINETNKVFYIDDLEKDQVKQKQILDLVSDVKIYFSCSMWVYFSKKNVNNGYISLTKSILKDSGYKLNPYYPRDEENKNRKRGLIIEKSK